MKNRNYVLPIIFIFIMMILAAAAENVRGVFIPLFKNDFFVNDTEIGFMLTISQLGYLIFTYAGGMFCEKIGQKKVFIAGIISLIVSLLGLGISRNYITFLIFMFILNMGLALNSIAINTLIPVLFMSFQAVLMNMTHFCYGLGSTIVQRVSGVLLFNKVSWRNIYIGEAALFLLVLIFFLPVKIPNIHKSKSGKGESASKLNLLKNKLIYFYALGLGFYVFAEMGTASWFVNFIEKVYSYDKSRSSFYLALFFGLLTLGRLIGGFIAERLGYLKTVVLSLIAAAILFVAGIKFGESGLILIAMAGLFFAVTFPTVVVTISKVFKEHGAYATGIIVTASSATNMILSMIMGYFNDKLGVYNSFYLIPIGLFASILCIFIVYRNVRSITG
jgi:fucose permease